jgi:hypothetical protein
MKKQIKKLNVLHTGIFMGIFYAIVTAMLIPVYLLIASEKELEDILVRLIAHPVAAFIAGIFAAIIYNLVSKWIGGLEVTLEDSQYHSEETKPVEIDLPEVPDDAKPIYPGNLQSWNPITGYNQDAPGKGLNTPSIDKEK